MERRISVVRVIRLCLLAGLGAVAWVVLGTSSAHADLVPAPSLTGSVGSVAAAVASTTDKAASTVLPPSARVP